MLKAMCAMMLGAALLAASFESSAVIIVPGGGGSSSSSDSSSSSSDSSSSSSSSSESSSSSSSSSESSSSSSSSGPDCNGAAPSTGIIWPPNNKMVAETIIGVTDPDALPISIDITGIHQDELVRDHEGDDAQPDGSGVGTSTAHVRAERSGRGTGLIYFISFTATNSQGRQCTGTVEVFVPHHPGLTPTDTGRRYDSTAMDDGRDHGRDDDRDNGHDDGGGRHDH